MFWGSERATHDTEVGGETFWVTIWLPALLSGAWCQRDFYLQCYNSVNVFGGADKGY